MKGTTHFGTIQAILSSRMTDQRAANGGAAVALDAPATIIPGESVTIDLS